jgi:hypothetical protein
MSGCTVLRNSAGFRNGSGLIALFLLLGLTAAVPADAQSLFAGRGLGLVMEPVDARGAGMGGVTLGLPRGEISWTNPADMTGLLAPGLRAVFQFDDFNADFAGRSLSGSTARFPLIMGAFPAGDRWVLSAGYGGFVDQHWAIEQTDTLVFGADSVFVLDRFASQGGIARLRLAAAYSVSAPLSVGVGVDAYTGLSQREFGRSFQEGQRPPCCTVEWRYSGFGGTAGVAWSPSEALNLSAAASFGGTLEARSDSVGVEGATFTIPTTLRAGGSARVAGNTLVAASAEWSGWGTLDGELVDVGGAQDSWSASGGMEWEGVQLRGRPFPVRLGARYASLPFSWDRPGAPATFPTERAATGGIGLLLAGGAARSDLSFEIGRRGGADAGVSESYSRFIFSVTALGR